MVDEINVVSELTQQEMKDGVIDLDITKRRHTVHRKNIDEMNDKQKEANKAGKPYCYRCAKLDMEKYQKERIDYPGYKKKYGTEKNIPYTVDHKKYSDPKHFKLLRETEIQEQKRVQGERLDYVTTFKDYQCVVRPNTHVSVEVSLPKPKG